MSRTRKPVTGRDTGRRLLQNRAFVAVVEQAIISYVETRGTCESVNIAVVIMSDGVTPPTQAIAADNFNLEKLDE